MVDAIKNLAPESAWGILLSYKFALHSKVQKDPMMGVEIYNSLVSGLADDKLDRLKDLLQPFQTREGASHAYIVAIKSQVQEILDSK